MMSAIDIVGIITMSSLSVLILTVTGIIIAFALKEFFDK
jgi:hypothetical protein